MKGIKKLYKVSWEEEVAKGRKSEIQSLNMDFSRKEDAENFWNQLAVQKKNASMTIINV